MDRALESLAAGDRLLAAGDYEEAIEAYDEAITLATHSSNESDVLNHAHHKRGVSLMNLGRYGEADRAFTEVMKRNIPPKTRASISIDQARLWLLQGGVSSALQRIEYAIQLIKDQDLAERGLAFSVLAQILVTDLRPYEALQYFGTADALLQRSDNRHDELNNLLCFMEALLDNGEWWIAQSYIRRATKLLAVYGGQSHMSRMDQIRQRTDEAYSQQSSDEADPWTEADTLEHDSHGEDGDE